MSSLCHLVGGVEAEAGQTRGAAPGPQAQGAHDANSDRLIAKLGTHWAQSLTRLEAILSGAS